MSPYWRGAARVCLLFTMACSQNTESPDSGVPFLEVRPVPSDCLPGVPCVEDRDCLGAPGTRCNIALPEPQCQTIRCGAENSFCSEDALCPANMRCWAGRCGTCEDVPLGGGCLDGQGTCFDDSISICGNECVDTSVDPRHCGGCDRPTPSQSVCSGGVSACGADLSTCDDQCVSLQTDAQHCGGCDRSCDYLRDFDCGELNCFPQVTVCSAGQCEMPVLGPIDLSCDEICTIASGRCARGLREDMTEVRCDDRRADVCICGFIGR